MSFILITHLENYDSLLHRFEGAVTLEFISKICLLRDFSS